MSVCVCVCVLSAGLWPSVLQRTERKCEATGPRKRMPSPAAGVAKGLDLSECVSVCVCLFVSVCVCEPSNRTLTVCVFVSFV